MNKLILIMDECENEILQAINKSVQKLPCYIVEMIVDKVHRQLKNGANEELTQARAQMNQEVDVVASKEESI